MAKETVYNNTLVSGAADETLTYTRYVKDESSGKSTKELLDEKVNKTDQLGTTQIADKAITTEKLENESVTTDKLDAASVTTDKVADANITTSKLADSSVETEKINNKAVTTDKLNDGAVDNSKLSPNAVTSEKIKNESIITEKLNDRAVTTEKVEEKAITNAKLGDQSVDGRVVREASLETKHFANESVTTEKVARKSITKDKLADNAVDTSQVVDGSIGNAKLSPDSVTTEKIKDGSVTNEKIADNTLGFGKFDPELRKTIQAATGLPEDLNQMIQDVDQSVKQLHEKDKDLQSQIDDKQQQITANDDDISLLQTRSTQMEEAIKGISASGGASQASAVTYENTKSELDSVTAQGAIDELQSKKFNKENIAQEFGDSEDKVVSQFALPFREIESPEFIKAIVDANNHLLFTINLDGEVNWSKGIPAPIRAKLQEIITQCQQDKTDLLGSINTINGILDKTTIKDEAGEIQDTPFRVISNEEFLWAVVDSEDRLLFGIYRYSGKPYFPLNEMYHVEQNKEFFAVWLDADDKVLLGIRRDGQIIGEIHAVNALKQVISQLQSDLATLQEKVGTIDTNLKELLDVFSLQENPEYMAVETDVDGKILSATNADGSHYSYNLKSETIPKEFSHLDDPEGRMNIVTDADGKIMAYRDKEGVQHENELEVNTLHTSNLNLKGNSVNDIQSALIANGFNIKTPIDWSESSFIQIPEPSLALINITEIDSMPTSKTDNKKAYLEFWDKQGNYFKKKVILNAQGANSLTAPKKNFAIDFCEDEWIGDNTTSVKFGNWVTQDGFHCKAFFGDLFRGLCVVCYKYMDMITKTRGFDKDRPWKKVLINYENINSYESGIDSPLTKTDLMFDTGAKCVPDGFPCIVHLNNVFYGVFSFQLKKHRDNYHMSKKTVENIHIDPDYIDGNNFFNGNIDWSCFEIRNPKQDSKKNKLLAIYKPVVVSSVPTDSSTYIPGDSVAINNNDDTYHVYLFTFEKKWKDLGNITLSNDLDGNLCFDYEYNGDYPRELSESNSISKKVKEYIQRFSNAIPTIKTAESTYLESSKTDEDLNILKSSIESFFDIDTLIDYIICSDVVNNWDGFRRNWQWLSYDGKKWFVSMYDCDNTFGSISTQAVSPFTSFLGNSTTLPSGWIHKYYQKELNDRYKFLADKGIISVDTIFNLIQDWVNRIGENNFSLEYDKWSNSYCFNKTTVNEEYWKLVRDSIGNAIKGSSITYSKETEYSENDICYFGTSFTNGNYYQFKCIKKCKGVLPATFRYIDNIYRLYKWINENINNMDNLYSYSRK